MDLRVPIAGLLGGAVIFVWSFLSWMVLPFHTMTVSDIPNEAAVVEALKDNLTESGVYTYPGLSGSDSLMTAQHMAGPRVPKLIYHPDGADPMNPANFAWGYFFDFVAATLVAFLLSKASADKLLGYGKRVLFVTLIGVLIAVYTDLMAWNWWTYPMSFTIINAYDNVITWALAGTVIAWRIDPEKF